MRILNREKQSEATGISQGSRMETEEELFENLREQLQQIIEESVELTDDELAEKLDNLVLERCRDRQFPLRKKEELRRQLFYSVQRLDILQELVENPGITEIMVNGCSDIFYEEDGKLHRWNKSFRSRERLEDVVQEIAGRCNRVVNEQRPIVDARLEDGSRVNIVLNPVALNGPIITIRRFPEKAITMSDLVERKSLTREAADFLCELVAAKYSLIVGGGTSTGKTTFLNALSSAVPPQERIITIEDNAELQLQGLPNLVRLEAKNSNMEGMHEITIRDLIKTSLRMRPDRIIVGEVRGAEAGDFLTCLNTGHDGSLGTAHANSIRDMISRLEMMTLAGMTLPVGVIRRQIAAGIDILVHLGRDALGWRYVEEIGEITGMNGEEVAIQTLYRRNVEGKLEKVGELAHAEKINEYRRLRERN
uniref:Flp pilus assembly protein, ATPase CpaF n=1 Tax=Eubacterium cellulosolvens (strain ATCC 43171 / JCM 9499 / 6) TaxID=633697 RepID=I5ATS8_EUBC6